MFNIAFFRVNGCHVDDLNSRVEVLTGCSIELHCILKLRPVFGWKGDISMVRHQDQKLLIQISAFRIQATLEESVVSSSIVFEDKYLLTQIPSTADRNHAVIWFVWVAEAE